jgi:hypothetical protein
MELKSRIILCEPEILIMMIAINAYDTLIQTYTRKKFSLSRTFKSWFIKSNTSEKLYRFGISFFLLSTVPLIGILINIQCIYLFLFISGISCLLCTTGFIYEAEFFLATTWGKPIGKWILSSLIAFAAALAAFISSLCARYAVNLILGTDPSHFTFTLTATIAILIPFAWIMISIVIFLIFYASSFLYIFFIYILSASSIPFIWFSIKNSRYYRFLFNKKIISYYQPTILSLGMDRVFARIIAFATLIISLYFSVYFPLNGIDRNSSYIYNLFTKLIVITNFYPIINCKLPRKHILGEAYAFIGNGMISIATPTKDGGYTFEPPRKCNQEKK